MEDKIDLILYKLKDLQKEIAQIKDRINEGVRRKQSNVSALEFAKFLSKL